MELLGVPDDPLTPWDPWATVEQMGNVRVEFTGLLPAGVGGACVVDRDDAAILLYRELSADARRWVLAHELCHVERDGGCAPAPWNSLWVNMQRKEERRVDLMACARLVPQASLKARLGTIGDGEVCEFELADFYQVPPETIRMALARLKQAMG